MLRIRLLGTVLLLCTAVCARSQSRALDPDTLRHNYDFYSQLLAPEKLYLHTDKDVYCVGEHIWFKAYLENHSYRSLLRESNFIYVELLQRDSVVQRVKIKRTEEGFAGHLLLPPVLPPGDDYLLRAYSGWMMNHDAAYFYQQPLEVVNPVRYEQLSDVRYRINADSSLSVIVRLRDLAGLPVQGQALLAGPPERNRKRMNRYTTNADGEIMVHYPSAGNASGEWLSIADPEQTFSRVIRLPSLSNDFDVVFLPEGGHLIANRSAHIAFKAVHTDGYGAAVTGTVFTAAGDSVCTFRTEYNGMGSFTFLPREGETYYAVVENTDGVGRRFEMPAAVVNASLQVRHTGSRMVIAAAIAEPMQHEPLWLLLHNGSEVLYLQPYRGAVNLSQAPFTPGIHHIVLLDGNGNILSERLFFKFPEEYAPTVHPHKDRYDHREKAVLHFSLSDADGTPLSGDFSLAVTDARLVAADSMADNLKTHLLLTGQLTGKIENPAGYFDPRFSGRERAMDLLMMVQGWRYYDLPRILSGDYGLVPFGKEYRQSISGRVAGLLAQNARSSQLTAFSPEMELFVSAPLGKNARFVIDSLDFSGQQPVYIHSAGKRGGKQHRVILDPEIFPEPGPPAERRYKSPVTVQYLQTARQQFYNSGGEDLIELEEIVVKGTARRIRPHYNPSPLGQTFRPDQFWDRKQLKPYDNYTLVQFIARFFPQLRFIRGDDHLPRMVYGRGLAVPRVALLMDKMPFAGHSVLSYLFVDDIENIAVLYGTEASAYGVQAVVMLTSRRTGRSSSGNRNFAIAHPLGWQVPKGFYAPRYELPEEREDTTPDYRTTLYWNPSVSIENGSAQVEFWTSDLSGEMRIVVEGIDEKGNYHSLTQILAPHSPPEAEK